MKNNSFPQVCVITPAFIVSKERFEYIPQTFCSIQEQDINLIHIIVDDASTFDPFIKFLIDYKGCGNVILIKRNKNGGISAAINDGLQALLYQDICLCDSIKYFTILHSDDYFYQSDSLRNRLSVFDNNTLMVHSCMGIFNQINMETIFNMPEVSDPYSNRRCFNEILFLGNHISYPTMIWQKDLFKKYYQPLDVNLNYGEDKLMALLSYKNAMENNLKISFCKKHTVVKRIHPNSISGGTKKNDIIYRLAQDRIIYSNILNGKEYENAINMRVLHYESKSQ